MELIFIGFLISALKYSWKSARIHKKLTRGAAYEKPFVHRMMHIHNTIVCNFG